MSWAAKRAARNSTRVMSGSCPINSTKNETNDPGLPLPLRDTDGNGSRGSPSRTCLPQRAAVAGLNKSILPAAAARNPPSIRFLKRIRRAIESAFSMAHPPTQDESQNVNSGNPQSIHQSMATLYCIGRNYADHAVEMGHDPDREPPFFFKAQFTSRMHGRLMAVARQARGEVFSSSSRSNHRRWLSGYLVARRLDSTARSPSIGCVGC